ncbi:MAG: hypothetical protein ACREPX_08270 [Rhodanobacteraceae bacterium]
MTRRVFAFSDASCKRAVAVDLDKLGGAQLGVNLYYQGVLLDPKLILNSYATPGGAIPGYSGDLTTDIVYEGSRLYFTVERAQDAVGTILDASANITFTYDDDEPSIVADLTDTGVTPGTYGDATHIPRITIDEKGRVTDAEEVDAAGGGGGGIIRARLATAAALPANTYSNGTAGVGATLTGTSTGVLTVDGDAVALDDIVLVKNEAAPARNGPYLCTTAGAIGVAYVLTRLDDMDEGVDYTAALVAVGPDGSTNPSSVWQCTAIAPVTVGTTAITFERKDFKNGVAYTDTGILITGGAIGGVALAVSVAASEVRGMSLGNYAYASGNWQLWVHPAPSAATTFTLDVRKIGFTTNSAAIPAGGDSIVAAAPPSITGGSAFVTASGSQSTWTASPAAVGDMITVVPTVNTASVQWYTLFIPARRTL